MSKPDPELVDIFLHNFGIDITEAKYQDALVELAYFFNKVIKQSIVDFMSAQIQGGDTDNDN